MARAPKQKKSRSGVAGFAELIITVAVAVGLAFLIQAFIVKPYRIPSASMEPTLSIGQRILVNRLTTHPKIGDVVVFHPPAGATDDSDSIGGQCGDPKQGPGTATPCDKATSAESNQTFVKRLVGLPGDHLTIKDGQVYNDGKEEKQAPDNPPYPCNAAVQASDRSCTFTKSITVPAGDYYMMGDDRGDSDDSRYWGPVPQKWIIGVAFFTYWPPNRIGTL